MFSLKQPKVLAQTLMGHPLTFIRTAAKITSVHSVTSIKTVPGRINHSVEARTERRVLLERPGLFAIKRGMIRWFYPDGTATAATVLEIDSCEVLGVKTAAKDGYDAVLIGTIDKLKNNKYERHMKLFNDAGVSPKHKIGEFRVLDAENLVEKGTELTADYFAVGQKVDVQGITKGKGFAGVMKRWGFSGGRATHGVSKAHRTPGAMGGNQNPGRVLPGKKMPGRMGTDNQTTFNLEVLFTDKNAGVLIVKGNVPGPKKGIVKVRDALKIYGDRLARINMKKKQQQQK
ncbi:50S ribosomal protein L3 [Candida viswanathii]|uniref:Large ribosomal subunit protein uL3m n=1 Tax=Candida viswanathii TaxID=5486 RepID=A0A367YCX7_9ASCO|nr:50S ribosomal protein L3 [Candida viswanathii]